MSVVNDSQCRETSQATLTPKWKEEEEEGGTPRSRGCTAPARPARVGTPTGHKPPAAGERRRALGPSPGKQNARKTGCTSLTNKLSERHEGKPTPRVHLGKPGAGECPPGLQWERVGEGSPGLRGGGACSLAVPAPRTAPFPRGHVTWPQAAPWGGVSCSTRVRSEGTWVAPARSLTCGLGASPSRENTRCKCSTRGSR